ARTVYELTQAGQDALSGWLEPAPEPMFEVRDEGMLKLFFSDVGTAEQRIDNLRSMRDAHRRTVAQLEELAAKAGHMGTGPRMTLELGLALHRWILDWCEEAERRLQDEGGRDAG